MTAADKKLFPSFLEWSFDSFICHPTRRVVPNEISDRTKSAIFKCHDGVSVGIGASNGNKKSRAGTLPFLMM